MPRRGENIRKRKDGRWEGRYKNEYLYTGKSAYVSVYGHSYAEVKQKLKAAQEAPPTVYGKMTVEYWMTYWFAVNKPLHKESTNVRYDFLIRRHILPELGKLPLTAIDKLTINRFLEHKQKSGGLAGNQSLSPAYVRSIAVILQSALQQATSEGVYPSALKIHKPSAEKRESRVLSAEEQHRLETHLKPIESGTDLGVLLALYGGLRAGEVCALSWDDVDLKVGVMQIRHTVIRTKDPHTGKTTMALDSPKTTASFRTIPLHPCLRPVLEIAYRNRLSPFVISDTDTFIHPRTFAYRFQQFLKSHQLPVVNFHTLRHTFATRCIAAGMDVKTLSELLGHSGVSVTLNTYVHSSLERKQQQLEKLVTFVPICGQNAGQRLG